MNLFKRKKIGCFIIVVIALALAVFTERCYTSPQFIKEVYYELRGGSQQLLFSDLSVQGYLTSGNQLTTSSKQANYLLIENTNRRVGTVTVHFSEPLRQSLTASLYYTRDGCDFNEGMRIQVQAQQGDTILVFHVIAPAQKIRLDIGEDTGNSFSIDRVNVNEPLRAISETLKDAIEPISISRSFIFMLLFLFIGFHFIFNVRKMYEVIYRYRYIVAFGLILFVGILQLHGSSIGMYDVYIQPGLGSELVKPVFGQAQAIRSDEWVVSTPWKLASAMGDHPFAKYNEIMRATTTVNLGTSGLYCSYASLANPFSFIIYIFGMKGFGAYWYSYLIACFMVSFEFCLILCRRRRLFALSGAFLITFSAYFQWWSYVMWIIYGQAVLVLCYYFFNTEQFWKRVLLALGIGISGAAFVCTFYPAWLVPAGYLFICIFIWMLVRNYQIIKTLKWKDWGIFALGVIFGVSVILAYVKADQEYLEAVANTVYPGARSSHGGMALQYIFNYFKTPLYPYINAINPCETGTFISLYPAATIMGIYVWFKSKKKDLLLTLLLIYSLFLTVYVTTGIPEFLAKITFMSYSSARRALNILDFIQIYLMLMVLTRYDDVPKMKPVFGIVLSVCIIGVAAWFASNNQIGYVPNWYIWVAGVVFVALCYCLFCKTSELVKKIMCFSLIAISLITGVLVNPIQKGFDVIYSKPLAKEIIAIVKEDQSAKWIGIDNLVLPSFTIACGAPTINSVNNYPNMELWAVIDPEGEYDEVYNRYAHMVITLINGESYPELLQTDAIRLNLNYRDIRKLGIEYIASPNPIQDNDDVALELVYSESNGYIYHVAN